MCLSEDSSAKTRAGQRLPSPWPGTALISIMGACQQAQSFLQLSAMQPGNWTGQRLWHSPNPADVDPEGPAGSPDTTHPSTHSPTTQISKAGSHSLVLPACPLAQGLFALSLRQPKPRDRRSIQSLKGDTCLQEPNTGDCNCYLCLDRQGPSAAAQIRQARRRRRLGAQLRPQLQGIGRQ